MLVPFEYCSFHSDFSVQCHTVLIRSFDSSAIVIGVVSCQKQNGRTSSVYGLGVMEHNLNLYAIIIAGEQKFLV
jgi:hypothetical protein